MENMAEGLHDENKMEFWIFLPAGVWVACK